jgi:predicted DNA-binding transcriptional regulator AlpA
MPKLLDYNAVRQTGVANNWPALNRRIANEGFPPGRLIGRKRLWTEAEVTAWIESRPVGKAPLRGWAKNKGGSNASASR